MYPYYMKSIIPSVLCFKQSYTNSSRIYNIKPLKNNICKVKWEQLERHLNQVELYDSFDIVYTNVLAEDVSTYCFFYRYSIDDEYNGHDDVLLNMYTIKNGVHLD